MTEILDYARRILFGGVVAALIYALVSRLSKNQKKISKDSAKANDEVFLDKKAKKPVKLIKRTVLSHDSAVLRFALDKSNRVLGLPVGKHFKLVMKNLQGVEAGKWNGRDDPEADKKEVLRSYTPTSGDENLGYVDLLVKFYLPKVKPQFPDGGKVSRQLYELKIGDEMFIQGPFGRIEYKKRGTFKIGSKAMEVTQVGMMAGGSGITPMLQIVRYALADSLDKTKFALIYANQTEEDILVRDELERYAKEYPSRFKVHFTLDRPTDGWKGSSGFITAEMIKENLPSPSKGTLMLMCGPPPMVKFACRANMEKLGYSKESQVEF